MPRPLFLTFEGLDGSGKSSHLRRVAAALGGAGVDARTTHEPGGTALGQELRGLFLDPRWGALDGGVELLLVFAARRQHLLEVIDPALAAGALVLCDRFTDSTYAYQGFGRGVAPETIAAVERSATGGRRPHRAILLDLPAPLARARRARQPDGDRLDLEQVDFYQRVRAGYLALARAEPERFRVIDAAGEVAATARLIRAALLDLLPELAEGRR